VNIKTGTDLELKNLLRNELQTLNKYVEMFDEMTAAEKEGLREWMANGRSVNCNGNYLYGENGCLLDFIEAYRMAEDMVANPDEYR